MPRVLLRRMLNSMLLQHDDAMQWQEASQRAVDPTVAPRMKTGVVSLCADYSNVQTNTRDEAKCPPACAGGH